MVLMDAKITLSFDEAVITKAKRYAADNNISLSRLIEFLLSKVTSEGYASFEAFPVSDWVMQVAEGQAQYKTAKRSRKSAKTAFYNSRKK